MEKGPTEGAKKEKKERRRITKADVGGEQLVGLEGAAFRTPFASLL